MAHLGEARSEPQQHIFATCSLYIYVTSMLLTFAKLYFDSEDALSPQQALGKFKQLL